MIKEIIELLTNWRFLWFIWIAFMPCWAAVIGYVALKVRGEI